MRPKLYQIFFKRAAATVITSVGTRSAENNTISTVAENGADWDVTLSATASSGTAVGDTLNDEATSPQPWLITAIADDVLTVANHFGSGSPPDNSGTTQATTTRTYATITLAEADFDDTDMYVSGDAAEIRIFNDSTYDEAVVINGGGTVGLASVKFTVPTTDRHDGTAGSGARIVRTSATLYIVYLNSAATTTWEWMEIDGDSEWHGQGIFVKPTTGGDTVTTTNNLIHNIDRYQNDIDVTGIKLGSSAGVTHNCYNNIIYDMLNSTAGGTQHVSGISIAIAGSNVHNIHNNTTHNIVANNASGDVWNYRFSDDADHTLRNNIGTDPSGTTSGTKQCFEQASPSLATVSNNMASDASASGTGSIDSVTTADQFVSITPGSEDLHLKSGSDAIGAGTTVAGAETDINGYVRDSLTILFAWDIGPHQYYIESSIGTAQDFTTFTLWEADLSATAGSADSHSVVRPLNETFTEAVTINATIPAEITVSPLSANRHDGTEGTGATISGSVLLESSLPVTFEFMDCTGGSTSGVTSNSAQATIVRNCIIRDVTSNSGNGVFGNSSDRDLTIANCIIYNINGNNVAGLGARGISLVLLGTYTVYNNIIYNVNNTTGGAARDATGIFFYDNAPETLKNNIICDTLAPNGTATDYYVATPATADVDYNVASDTTASGANSIDSVVTADQFVSISAGSEDFHLKIGSDAVDAGVDLGATNNVNITADGIDRESFTPERWSMGAFIGPKEITQTVGTGHGDEDHATLALWDADLADATIYVDLDSPTASVSNDAFSNTGTLSDTSFTWTTVTIRPRVGDEGDGTPGSGPRFIANTDRIILVGSFGAAATVSLNGLEVEGSGSNARRLFYISTAGDIEVKKCMIHEADNSGDCYGLYIFSGAGSTTTIENTVIYDITSSAGNSYGLMAWDYSGDLIVYNTTSDNVTGTGNQYAYYTKDLAGNILKNCIGSNAGTLDFNINSPSNNDMDYNCSLDASASGGNSLASTNPSYTATGIGSEDYTLLGSSACADAGLTIGSITDDIKAVARPQGAGYSMGAYEVAASAGGGSLANRKSRLTNLVGGTLV